MSKKLTEEQIQVVNDWIETKCNLKNCPLCASNNLQVEDYVGQLPVYSGSTQRLPLTQLVYPYVIIVCNNCGNTILINAIAIGLMDSGEDESDE